MTPTQAAVVLAVAPIAFNSPPGIATIETEAFINNHRPCAGEAA